MINNNNQVKGLILTSIGVLAIVPDSILIRLIQADILTITFWRALIPGIIISIAVMIFYRKPTIEFIKSPKPSGLIFIVSHSFGTLLFVVAIELTSIANALFIISTSPIFAAIISRIFLNEKITIRMIFTIIGALIGIGIITFGSFNNERVFAVGDVAALGTAFCLAISLTAARSASNFSMIPAVGISSLATPLCILYFIDPFNLQFSDWMFILLLGVVFAPIATCLIATGPRYITSAEVSLLLLLEAVLAPILAWFILFEFPGYETIIGGIIVISVLVFSNIMALHHSKKII
jgi:drug/metabolite transporter (DMT)-like permease